MKTLVGIVGFVLFILLWVWVNEGYANACIKRGGTVLRGGRDGALCIESAPGATPWR